MKWTYLPPLSAVPMEFVLVCVQAFMFINARIFVAPENVTAFSMQIMSYMVLLVLFRAYVGRPLFAQVGLGPGAFWFMAGLLGGSVILLTLHNIIPVGSLFQVSTPIYLLLTHALVVAVSEELIFRGYAPRKLGVIPSCIFFGIMHSAAYGLNPISIAVAIGAGFVFYFVAQHSNIYTAMGLHAAYNLIALGVITSGFPFLAMGGL